MTLHLIIIPGHASVNLMREAGCAIQIDVDSNRKSRRDGILKSIGMCVCELFNKNWGNSLLDCSCREQISCMKVSSNSFSSGCTAALFCLAFS